MQILRDRPSPSLGYPILAPLDVALAGADRIRATAWSMRGFVIAEPLDIEPGSPVDLVLYVDFQGFEVGIPASAEHLGSGEFDFVDLSHRSRALLEQFTGDLVHGRITTTDDTLLRIDTPEDPISVKPDAPKQPAGRTRSIRPFVMSAFYLLMGLMVFGYVGILVHANFVKLEIQTAVVSRPVEVFSMPTDGQVATYRTTVGARVRAGDLLAVISDPELEAKIDDQRIALRASETAVRRLQRTIEVERARFADYQVINETEALISVHQVSGLEEEKTRTAQHLSRIQHLKERGFATQAQLDEALAADALTASRLTSARLMAARTGVLHDVAPRRHHNGREFIVDLDLLALDLDAAESQREEQAARLAVLLERRAKLAMTAPFDGRVLEVIHAADTPLLRGAHLLTIEHDVAPVIEAWLNQEEILTVGLGDFATVLLPALDRKITARVVEIDRTSGFVDEQQAQYVWRGPKDRSARVVLQLHENSGIVASGLPAIVLFDRRGTSAVGRDLADRVPWAGDDV